MISSENRSLYTEQMTGKRVEMLGVNESFERLYKKEGATEHMIEVVEVQMNVCFLWLREPC